MKKVVLAICIGFFAAASIVSFAARTETALAHGIIRLHVRANSNSEEDQSLKLKVRDRILSESKAMAQNISDTESAQNVIIQNLDHLQAAAQNEIAKNGYDYPVNIRFGKSDFPTRIYGDMTLPAGAYEALIVEIGSGKGENWWCVMFPPLCFTEETFAGATEDTEEILIQNLGSDTYSMVKNDKIQIKFKIYELIQAIR